MGLDFYRPDALHFRDSFPDLGTPIIGNTSVETAGTLESFLLDRLVDANEYQSQRHASFVSGVLDPLLRDLQTIAKRAASIDEKLVRKFTQQQGIKVFVGSKRRGQIDCEWVVIYRRYGNGHGAKIDQTSAA